jgi:hypothetical protein
MPAAKWMTSVAALTLAACSGGGEEAAPAPTETATAASAGGVERETVAPPTPSPTPAAAAAIQTQQGPKGNTVSLNRVAVTGDIMTVSMTFSGSDNCCVHIDVDDVAVIDDATAQRIGVLKDNTGKWMAAPLESQGKTVQPDDYDSPSVLWFKFPAPPATSRTVSITVPGVAPFDAVPVTR